ncbi:monooxygenase [Podospora didyma]|uniref:Monooxygenase n=1 Tax=Podospora didyma TaxID=330526 RepID=A0AAE0NZG1_9PEZI|nr:monooxygenase [Podospora didyma]
MLHLKLTHAAYIHACDYEWLFERRVKGSTDALGSTIPPARFSLTVHQCFVLIGNIIGNIIGNMMDNIDDSGLKAPGYSQFACIGAGFSGVGLGATLKRWYGLSDIRIFERENDVGGVWQINQYPGAACDIPGILYSFSFEPSTEGSRRFPPAQEMRSYLRRVAYKYDLLHRISFNTSVEHCEWDEEKRRWRLHVQDRQTGILFLHESQFLFAGAGFLVKPRELDVPGGENFGGTIMHSARWRHDVSLEDKNVVVFGNGCTAAQIVPTIVDKTKHLTQVVRTKHWITPLDDSFAFTPLPKTVSWSTRCRWRFQRFLIALSCEIEYLAMSGSKIGNMLGQSRMEMAKKYVRAAAPDKYHELLIPEFKLGCKRRIFDQGYIKSLHAPNITLTNEPALEIVPEGIRTKDGITEADVIILANGFDTSGLLFGISVTGRGGESVTDHWNSFGGAEAYETTAMSGFPNFFMLAGPNSATGHTSVVIATENAINFALRVIKPVLDGEATRVELKREAEVKYVDELQNKLQNDTVFSKGGCRSWYFKEDKATGRKWNAFIYPYWQAYFWYRCLFPTWGDWEYGQDRATRTKKSARQTSTIIKSIAVVALLVLAECYLRYQWGRL